MKSKVHWGILVYLVVVDDDDDGCEVGEVGEEGGGGEGWVGEWSVE